MKTSRKLEPLDIERGAWHKQIISISLECDDRIHQYEGNALVSEPVTAHVIEFQFRTTALRPAEVNIPLVVSSNASVKLQVNDTPIATLEFTASGAEPSLIRWICLDVTKWTEPCECCQIQLLISYRGEKGTTTIPLGNEPELQPRVSQNWNWGYGIQSVGFFALAWSSIIALAILILAHIQPLGDTFRFYAVLFAVLTWIAGVCGLPDLARVPLRPALRRLYSKTQAVTEATSPFGKNRRAIWLASLFLFAGLACSGAGVVIYCLVIREYYSSLIDRAVGESNDPQAKLSDIKKALSLLPWRQEAQMLFEQEAYGKRDPENLSDFRQYMRAFANDQSVKEAITQSPDIDHLPFCLTKSAGTSFLNDPAVWYASTIVEGEDFGETSLMNEAISLLSIRKDQVAQIQLGNIKLGLLLDVEQSDPKQANKLETEEAARELMRLLDLNYNLRGRIEYQVACDTLGGYYLQRCDPNAPSESLIGAATWYKKEISARKHQATGADDPLWLRPPDKLLLFYMFGSGSSASNWNLRGKAVDNARCLLRARDCPPLPGEKPFHGDDPCDFAPTFEKELRTNYTDYQSETAWTKGTVMESGLKLPFVIEESLKKGWRY